MTTQIVTKDLAGLKTSVSLTPSDDNILSEKAAVDYVAAEIAAIPSSDRWAIGWTLSDQTDLQTVLDGLVPYVWGNQNISLSWNRTIGISSSWWSLTLEAGNIFAGPGGFILWSPKWAPINIHSWFWANWGGSWDITIWARSASMLSAAPMLRLQHTHWRVEIWNNWDLSNNNWITTMFWRVIIQNPSSVADTAVSTSGTQTLTNKRITRRLVTINTPWATPTMNTDDIDIIKFTGLDTDITSMTTNLSGTPVEWDKISLIFIDDGTPRTITRGASFAATSIALPTTTVANEKLRVGFEWGGSTWDCVAVV